MRMATAAISASCLSGANIEAIGFEKNTNINQRTEAQVIDKALADIIVLCIFG